MNDDSDFGLTLFSLFICITLIGVMFIGLFQIFQQINEFGNQVTRTHINKENYNNLSKSKNYKTIANKEYYINPNKIKTSKVVDSNNNIIK